LAPDESFFADRVVSQLLAAAIAWRPLSSMPFGDVAPSGSSLSSGEFGESREELLCLPISSAGNGGTGDWLRAAVRSLTSASALSARSGAELAEFSSSSFAALAPDCAASELDDFDLVRDEDMTSLSTVASAVCSSESISRPRGATIRDGSVTFPASSTPSSSIPTGAPLYAQQRLYDEGDSPFAAAPPGAEPPCD
jgi:hypothetical protein